MAMKITQFLVDARSHDARVRHEAERSLRQFQEQHLPQFLLSLSFELANEDKHVESRQLAGILLKNSLPTQWIEVDMLIQSQIKDLLLTTLASSVVEARRTAAQVIAKVASIEIPQKQWPELLKSLRSNMMCQQASPASPLELATMETLGYLCEEISNEDLVPEEVLDVHGAICLGMRPSTSAQVHLAATKALLRALNVSKVIFENDMHTCFLMTTLGESALSKEVKIRRTAFKCLVLIASMYYKALGAHMAMFFKIVLDAISGDDENVTLQAIEFWISICVNEIELQKFVNPDHSPPPHFGFIEKAFRRLVPILLETLLKQQEDWDQGDDVWNISKACGTCLGLFARVVGVDTVPYVISFLEAKISDDSSWKSQAAMHAFGSILDVPTLVKLAVSKYLLTVTNDGNKFVGDTTSRTLSYVFKFFYGPTSSSPVNFYRFVAVLLKGIYDEVPNVAEKICDAIYKLAQRYENFEASSYLPTPYPTEIIQNLIVAAKHKDGEASKIRADAAYDTLNVVVRYSNVDEASNIIAHLISQIVPEIEHTIHIPMLSMDDREKQAKLYASLCVVLQILNKKLSGTNNV